jgi:hypothetical protein
MDIFEERNRDLRRERSDNIIGIGRRERNVG